MLLQPKLNVKVSQRQALTPGLVQMVSVLALNKLELKDMINAEMVENPVLEELDETDLSWEERAGLEGDRDRSVEDAAADRARDEKDPFDEIDFGSYFQDYLDPGFKSPSVLEEYDKPSFEHFLSQPSTLTDHLLWQLGSLTLDPAVRTAAELVVGNLDSNGYLIATDEELLEALRLAEQQAAPIPFERGTGVQSPTEPTHAEHQAVAEALAVVQQLDPLGVGARSLRECLLIQIGAEQGELRLARRRRALDEVDDPTLALAAYIVEHCLPLLQKKDMRELVRGCAAWSPGTTAAEVQVAVDHIRTLDPRPGQRFDSSETRLIEPDVAFVKRDSGFAVLMNEEDLPTLRLNGNYRRMLRAKQTEKEVRDYVKERYRSAIQLLRNIEQRKNTIVRTCECIIRRQEKFLESGEEALRPMMIKEVAEEIGVHPSTVSRAVANKYVHTPQGVYELRFFFSEGVNGPEGGDLPLVLLKRKVRKLIDGEDPRKPLTDDHLAAELKAQGINVNRRTVAKYREDMQIPSTHQRRVR